MREQTVNAKSKAFHNAVVARGWEDPDFSNRLREDRRLALAVFASECGYGKDVFTDLDDFDLPDNPVGQLSGDYHAVLDAHSDFLRVFDPQRPLMQAYNSFNCPVSASQLDPISCTLTCGCSPGCPTGGSSCTRGYCSSLACTGSPTAGC